MRTRISLSLLIMIILSANQKLTSMKPALEQEIEELEKKKNERKEKLELGAKKLEESLKKLEEEESREDELRRIDEEIRIYEEKIAFFYKIIEEQKQAEREKREKEEPIINQVMQAISQGDKQQVKVILESNEDLSKDAFDHLVGNEPALKILFDAGWNGLSLYDDLCSAAELGEVNEIKKEIIENKVDPNGRGSSGYTPLIAAAMMGQTKAVETLLDLGAAVNAVDERHGSTALHFAAITNLELVSLLLQRGADPTLKDNYGDFPLNDAADDDIIAELKKGMEVYPLRKKLLSLKNNLEKLKRSIIVVAENLKKLKTSLKPSTEK